MTSISAAVIGLGSMGFGIAQSCVRGQISTYGVDVATKRMTQFVQEGGESGSINDAVAVSYTHLTLPTKA